MIEVRRALAACTAEVGAIVVEPMLGRGGVVLPPDGFLRALREEATRVNALLIVDEIYTGFHRAGRASSTRPSCKARLRTSSAWQSAGGGLPMSACLGDEKVMRAWGDPDGEAIHTATSLVNRSPPRQPSRCSISIASTDMPPRSNAQRAARSSLRALIDSRIVIDVRGRGWRLAWCSIPVRAAFAGCAFCSSAATSWCLQVRCARVADRAAAQHRPNADRCISPGVARAPREESV